MRMVLLLVLLAFPYISLANTPIIKLTMNNVQGEAFIVGIAATNETNHVVTEDEIYGGADAGDHIISGRFFITLQAIHRSEPNIRTRLLFGSQGNKGEFNINREIAFIVHGSAGYPDILCVEQYGDSSNADLYLFYIVERRIKPIKIQSANSHYDEDALMEMWSKQSRLHYNAAHRLQCMEYLQGVGLFRKYVWDFSPVSGHLSLWYSALFTEDKVAKSAIPCGYTDHKIIMAPLMELSESLGAKVKYNKRLKMYRMAIAGTIIEYTVGSVKVKVNGRVVLLPRPSALTDGDLYVPLIEFAKCLRTKMVNTVNTIITLKTIQGQLVKLDIFPDHGFPS